MKKWIALFVAMMLALTLLAGCSGPGRTDTDDDDQEVSSEVSDTTTEVSDDVSAEAPVTNGTVSTGNPVVDSYTAFTDAKYVVINRLTDGLGQDENAMMAYITIAGVSMADLALAPIAMMGYDEATVAASMAYLGAQGVIYSVDGNSYTMTYTGSDGKAMVYNAIFNPAAESMVMMVSVDGAETVYSEYYKTSFGYVSQSYFASDDGTGTLYQYSITGEDGVFGYSNASAKPAALTGNEPASFPQNCDEWYAVTGNTITGENSDGAAINFEYTPTPSNG